MFNEHDIRRNQCQLFGSQARKGYDWWWHSLTAHDAETEEERAFFFEYFVCNYADRADEPHYGRLGQKPSYLMVKAGTWGKDKVQLHRFFGLNKVRLDFGVPFVVEADDCYCSEKSMHGRVAVSAEETQAHPEWMCDSGEICWNMEIDKQVAFNVGYGASTPMRRWQLFEMFWHAEGMKTAYRGEITYNGRKYIVSPDTCYGYADKNWGKDFTSPWVWLSSNNLVSELTGKRLSNSVFDIGGGCPKVGPVALPRQLLSAVWYEGKALEFNFSKFWTLCRTQFDCHETDTEIVWHVEQRAIGCRMVVDIICKKADMLLVNYEAPDGLKRHNRLWNGGNGIGTITLYEHGRLLDRIHAENIGCEYGEYD